MIFKLFLVAIAIWLIANFFHPHFIGRGLSIIGLIVLAVMYARSNAPVGGRP